MASNRDLDTRLLPNSEEVEPVNAVAASIASGSQPCLQSPEGLQPPEGFKLKNIFLGWVFPLVKRATQVERLETTDLFDLETRAQPEVLFQAFIKEWRKQVARGPRRRGHLLLWVLARVHFASMWPLWIGRITSTVLEFSFPLFLNLITKFVEEDGEKSDISYGLALAGALFVVSIVAVLLDNNVANGTGSLGLRVRSTMITAIFRKVIIVRQDSLSSFSTGKLNNLITTDVDKCNAIRRMHILLMAPISLTISFVALYHLVGAALFIGLGWMVVVILVNPLMMQLSSKFEETQQAKTDERVRKATEVITAMQVVKCYAWEGPATRTVEGARKVELRAMFRLYCLYTVFECLWSSVIPITTVVMFTAYSFLHPNDPMKPSQAFTAIALLGMVSEPLFSLPWVLNQIVEAIVAARRLEHLFFLPEVRLPSTKFMDSFLAENILSEATQDALEVPDGDVAIEFVGQSFRWASREAPPDEGSDSDSSHEEAEVAEDPRQPLSGDVENGTSEDAPNENNSSTEFMLSDLVLSLPQRSLVGVVGPTASGKTSLLQAILGEMPLASAHLENTPLSRDKPIGFAPQQPWVFNATVRENILFGEAFVEERYTRCIQCCDLEDDLATLKHGDKTKVGEKGIALSGGQKARICLARAAYRYSRSDVFLLDDPYSALDAHVARKVHDQVVQDLLGKKTRVVVTNRLEFVHDCDYVVVMQGGKIEARGTYSEVVKSCASFSSLLAAQGIDIEAEGTEEMSLRQRTISSKSGGSGAGSEGDGAGDEEDEGRFDDDEEESREVGNVKKEVVYYYLSMMGGCKAVSFLAFMYIFSELVNLAGPIWLAHWTKDAPSAKYFDGYLAVYVILSVVNVVFMTARDLTGNILGFRAARNLHATMFAAILRAPMAFFQETPHGRIVNRFSKDTSEIDKDLVWQVIYTVVPILTMFGNFLMVGAFAYFALFAFLPALYLYYLCWKYYNKTAVDLKRITKVTGSPIYDHFNNLCRENATCTVRACHQVGKQCNTNNILVTEQQRPQYSTIFVEQWFSACVETLGCILVFFVAVFAVLGKGELISGSAAALVLTFAGECSNSINTCISQIAEFSTAFNCVERVKEYCTTLKSEAPLLTDHRPSEAKGAWPNKGVLEVRDLELRYRPELDLVLKGVSFVTSEGERLGIVGRTGAGKSSLLLALLRIVEPEESSIMRLDGENLLTMGLQDVRSNIAIIPQEPVLFQESLRYNCDPFSHHSDEEIWAACEEAQLAPWIRERNAGSTSSSVISDVSARSGSGSVVGDTGRSLQLEISEGGQNLSAGQRQMVSIARAVLRKTRLVVLDEATASVDAATDKAIQEAVRRCFHGATTLTIAHRLQTILDSDRVLVMDKGVVAELASPAELLANEGGIFRCMVDESTR